MKDYVMSHPYLVSFFNKKKEHLYFETRQRIEECKKGTAVMMASSKKTNAIFDALDRRIFTQVKRYNFSYCKENDRILILSNEWAKLKKDIIIATIYGEFSVDFGGSKSKESSDIIGLYFKKDMPVTTELLIPEEFIAQTTKLKLIQESDTIVQKRRQKADASLKLLQTNLEFVKNYLLLAKQYNQTTDPWWVTSNFNFFAGNSNNIILTKSKIQKTELPKLQKLFSSFIKEENDTLLIKEQPADGNSVYVDICLKC